MARHLVAAGHEVVGCDVDRARVEQLGASVGADARSGRRRSGGGPPLAPDTGRGRGGRPRRGRRAGRRRAGTLLVDMSTSPPALARRLAFECAELDVLDAPVSGGPRGAEDATLTIMVGGGEAVFRRALPLFEALGRLVVLVGPHGAGQTAKLCNNLIAGATMAAIAESCAIARGGARPARALRARERVDRRLARTPHALPARGRRRRAPVLAGLRAAVRAGPDREGHRARVGARRGAGRRRHGRAGGPRRVSRRPARRQRRARLLGGLPPLRSARGGE